MRSISGFLTAMVVVLCSCSVAVQAPSDVQHVAFVDDSFGEGYGAPAGQGYLDLLESYQPGDNVLPVAHGGATVRRYLPGGPWHSALDQLTAWAPATVVIPLSINDWYMARPVAQYRADLTALITLVREKTPYGVRVVLWHRFGGYVTPDPRQCDITPCTHQSPPASWHDYGQAMRAVAIERQTGYIDDSTAYPWRNYLYDGLHPNAAGHRLLAQSISSRLYQCC